MLLLLFFPIVQLVINIIWARTFPDTTLHLFFCFFSSTVCLNRRMGILKKPLINYGGTDVNTSSSQRHHHHHHSSVFIFCSYVRVVYAERLHPSWSIRIHTRRICIWEHRVREYSRDDASEYFWRTICDIWNKSIFLFSILELKKKKKIW